MRAGLTEKQIKDRFEENLEDCFVVLPKIKKDFEENCSRYLDCYMGVKNKDVKLVKTNFTKDKKDSVIMEFEIIT